MATLSYLIIFLQGRSISLSHDKVKLALGLFCGFVFAIASPLYGFLYLNKEYIIKQKSPLFPSSNISSPPPAIEISILGERIKRVSPASYPH